MPFRLGFNNGPLNFVYHDTRDMAPDIAG